MDNIVRIKSLDDRFLGENGDAPNNTDDYYHVQTPKGIDVNVKLPVVKTDKLTDKPKIRILSLSQKQLDSDDMPEHFVHVWFEPQEELPSRKETKQRHTVNGHRKRKTLIWRYSKIRGE